MFMTTPAIADDIDNSGPRLYVSVDGKLVDLQSEFEKNTFDLTPPDQTVVSPRLIDFGQWTSCYTFNNQEDVFREYNHFWNGSGHDVRLKCGTTGTSGWGYRHIEEGHGAQWQSQLDQARAKGWNPAWQGVNSWDDLMAGAAGSAVTFPEIVGGNPVSQTKCGITDLYLVHRDNPQVVLMTIRVLASWATNSDRLITVYPTNKSSC